ncbi:hypothetical protein [Pseudoduganella violaceinigra]|uniref:hypothetical protein n=1 Tax=Pseudoduganella violaceinigra TaxID=246602 RepID=UPI0004052154|nr:hypothetical protein [Pseudoduganella violaceinigra]
MVFSFFKNIFRRPDPVISPPPAAGPAVKPQSVRPEIAAQSRRLKWHDLAELEEQLGDYSGYVRQAAVERCLELSLPGTLPLVATRLNDWVPQVRDAARAAVLAMLADASPEDQCAALQIVGALRNANRTSHAEWISAFEDILLSSAGEDGIWDWYVAAPNKLARICFEILLKRSSRILPKMLANGVSSRRDIVIACRSAQIARELPVSEGLPVLRIALNSQFGAVRRIALQALLANGGAGDLVLDYLLDMHGTVRGIAMSHLREQQFDLNAFYRSALLDSAQRPTTHRIALLSLASLGSSGDLALVKEYTNAAASRLRGAAYAAWMRLAPNEKDELMLRAFSDRSPLVRKFARQVLEKHGGYASFPDLHAAIGANEYLLGLMFTVRGHKWNWLEAISLVARDIAPGSPLEKDLAAELLHWISSARWSRLRPIGAQAQSLSDPVTVQRLERLIAGDADSIGQMREHLAQGLAA